MDTSPPDTQQVDPPVPEDLGRVHFMGIGGAGMSGIARIMLARGVAVGGCDAKDSRALAALRARGADVQIGHDPAHAADADTVVVSSAIRGDNEELVAAHELGRRVLPRAAALASVMAGRRGIAVAGTAGKTTTTSMLTVAIQACGGDPSYAIGGDLNEPGSNAHYGSGEFFVAEADESDRSFLLLSPEAAVVTNVEADHLDNYGSLDAVRAAFTAFLERLPDDGVVALGADDDGAMALAEPAHARGLRVITYGVADAVDVGPGTVDDVKALTDGLGVDVAIEAVGVPETLRTAAALVRPGGRIANIGVHGVPVELPMQDLWIQNVTLSMGLVDTTSIPTLLRMVAGGRIPAEKMGTHRFTFGEIDRAYEVFGDAAAHEALKVVITP